MKSIFYVLAIANLSFAGATPSPEFNSLESSQHVVVHYNSHETKTEEAKVIVQSAEQEYTKLSQFLGKENTPDKVTIFLEGPAFNTRTQKFSYPSVDKHGHVHLYRFPGETFAYSEAIAHELVHVFRTSSWSAKSEQNYMTGFGFIEEGFAEFVSIQTAPLFKGFVRYGFPLEIVVGFLLEDQKDIPLGVLFDHHEINPKCIAQAYPLRASFFQFLFETFGKEKVFQLAYYEKGVSKDTFLEIFGLPFDSLVYYWKMYALDKYAQVSENTKLKKDYLETTPIQHFPFCKAGTDW